MAGITAPYHLQSIETFLVFIGDKRQLTLSERNVLAAYVQGATEEIARYWPVDTGNSRDHWQFTISGDADWIGFTIENLVDYVEWVHPKGNETPYVDGWVPDVIDMWIARLIPALKAEIIQTQRRLDTVPATATKREKNKYLNSILQQQGQKSLQQMLEALLGK